MNIVKAATDTYWKRNNQGGWDSYNQYGELIHAANYDDARIGQWLSNKVVKFCADDFKFQKKPVPPKIKLYTWNQVKSREGTYIIEDSSPYYKFQSDGHNLVLYINHNSSIEIAVATAWEDFKFVEVPRVKVDLGSFEPLDKSRR